MTQTQVRVYEIDGKFDLCCHYTHQTEVQGCYVELDCETGRFTADYNAEIGYGVPEAVWHGRTRRYEIPCLLAEAANKLLAELAPLAQRIVDGYEAIWDGNNHVGKLDEDAQMAEAELERCCTELMEQPNEADCIVEWDAADWLSGCDTVAEYGITGQSTDRELADIGERIEAEAPDNTIIDGLVGYLQGLRDDLMDDDGDEA